MPINSSIHAKLKSSKLPSTFQTPFEGGVKIPNYFIGDPAYPLLPFCMKECDAYTINKEVIFNNMLHSARNQIESAFGRLKARWSILTTKMDFKREALPTIIYARFVLYNYCEQHNLNIDEDLVMTQIELMKENEVQFKNIPDPVYSCDAGEGIVVRRILTDLVMSNL